MDTLSLILYIALAFAILYMFFILFKFGSLACFHTPESETELLERFRRDFPRSPLLVEDAEDGKGEVQRRTEGKKSSNLEQSYIAKPSITSAEKLQPNINTNQTLPSRPKPKPLSPVLETLVPDEEAWAWRKPRETSNNFQLLRQHGEREISSGNPVSVSTPEHRPCNGNEAILELRDSGGGRLYPSESFQTLDEFPDSLSVRGRSVDQPDSLVADSSLVIGTAASNGKIVGYCVNLVRRKCSFYSYQTAHISLEGIFPSALQQQQQQGKQCEVFPAENLYFASLLWQEKIRKYQTFRLYSNHQIESSENERTRQLKHFLDHLLKENGHRVVRMNSNFYVGFSSRHYNTYGIPAVYLLNGDFPRFQALINDTFKVENIQGTHELQAADGVAAHDPTTKYSAYLLKVESSLKTKTCECLPDFTSPST